MATELVYIGDYHNHNDFQLFNGSSAIDMSAVTQIDANINGVDVTSTNQSSDLIRWDQAGYKAGEIRCTFGAAVNLVPGNHNLYFIIYDPTNPNGIIFEGMTLLVIQLP